jgi:hypothetical protein
MAKKMALVLPARRQHQSHVKEVDGLAVYGSAFCIATALLLCKPVGLDSRQKNTLARLQACKGWSEVNEAF